MLLEVGQPTAGSYRNSGNKHGDVAEDAHWSSASAPPFVDLLDVAAVLNEAASLCSAAAIFGLRSARDEQSIFLLRRRLDRHPRIRERKISPNIISGFLPVIPAAATAPIAAVNASGKLFPS